MLALPAEARLNASPIRAARVDVDNFCKQTGLYTLIYIPFHIVLSVPYKSHRALLCKGPRRLCIGTDLDCFMVDLSHLQRYSYI